MILGKYSFGIGDRFGQQGPAQLQAFFQAKEEGLATTPVWNKSHREHTVIGSSPADVRKEADDAVQSLGWTGPYYVDADHITLQNVDLFLDSSDFFTLDVADVIGRPAAEDEINDFVKKHNSLAGTLFIPGLDEPFDITADQMKFIASKFLLAIKEAGRIYRHIENKKGAGNFIVEVSMDETDSPQSPLELLFILAAISDEGIPTQTIAPKFTGRLNKGVDYSGSVAQFKKETKKWLVLRLLL